MTEKPDALPLQAPGSMTGDGGAAASPAVEAVLEAVEG
jgi:hypothetical protein